MVSENVDEISAPEEAQAEQFDAEDLVQEGPNVEELAQELAMRRGYYDGQSPPTLSLLRVSRRSALNSRGSWNGVVAPLPKSSTWKKLTIAP
jgi:hypothetical protein